MESKNFPNVTLDEHFKQLLTNKHFSKKYSSLYSKQAEEFESQNSDNQGDNQYEIPEPPKACSRLREKLLKKHSNIFKEKLSTSDRINAPPIRLRIDPSKDVTPLAHSRPYDIPYNLREPMNREFSDTIEAGVLYSPHVTPIVIGYTRCSLCPSQGSQKFALLVILND